jgi:hypothetical protein
VPLSKTTFSAARTLRYLKAKNNGLLQGKAFRFPSQGENDRL